MPYIGNQASSNFSSIEMQTLTGNGGTSYTLSKNVANQNEIEVYVNNVRQEPGVAYTANNNALTMTGNVVSSDGFYVIYQGKAVQTTVPPDGSVGTAQLAPGTIPTVINTAASDPTKTTNATLGSVYVNSTTGEMYICTDATTNNNVFTNVGSGEGGINTPTFPVHYVLIGGGGAGGNNQVSAGGGGAGGYRSSWNNEISGGGCGVENALTFARGTTYTITVGAGGTTAGSNSGGGNTIAGNSGGNSSIAGTGIATLTSLGGAGGAGYTGAAQTGGGSGGGGAGNSGGVHSDGTACQGFDGGTRSAGHGSGGGGGAGSVGANSNSAAGGNGGTGVASTITGTSVLRAGGGGGGADLRTSSSFGVGTAGGGNGGNDSDGHAGTANTGGGGGGAGYGNTNTFGVGGVGGSGVAILRMHESGYAGSTVTGSPTVTSVGSDKVLVYTQSGTFVPA